MATGQITTVYGNTGYITPTEAGDSLYVAQTGSVQNTPDSQTGPEYSPTNYHRWYSSFSGADITANFLIPGFSEPKIFAQLRSISYSIVRDKRPLRLLGSINPVCWSKSTRLVAGTLVFTSFDRYVWYQLTGEKTDPKGIILADMLPPFDITITAINEYGQCSRLTVRGVRIVDEGAVIGVDDLYVEMTHTYIAQDIVPWIATRADGEEDEGYPAPGGGQLG
jgi:hypothetical protein